MGATCVAGATSSTELRFIEMCVYPTPRGFLRKDLKLRDLRHEMAQ